VIESFLEEIMRADIYKYLWMKLVMTHHT